MAASSIETASSHVQSQFQSEASTTRPMTPLMRRPTHELQRYKDDEVFTMPSTQAVRRKEEAAAEKARLKRLEDQNETSKAESDAGTAPSTSAESHESKA